MYCIIQHDEFDYHKSYMIYQNRGGGLDDYFFADKETFLLNVCHQDKNYPTLFKTEADADKFMSIMIMNDDIWGIRAIYMSYEWVDSQEIPYCKNCNMDCWKCNKRNIYHCKKLRNPYQNICGFMMAKFEDGFTKPEGRLDAPCEQCLTFDCHFNQKKYEILE